MNLQIVQIFLLFLCGAAVTSFTIVIRNNPDTNSRKKAEQMKADLLEEAKVPNIKLNVVTTTDKWAPNNAWTIIPIFQHIYEKYHKSSDWVLFCEETTEINLKVLIETLAAFDPNEKFFFGNALYDAEPSIIHHFAFHENPSVFKYPDAEAGWVVSMVLLKDAVERLRKNPPNMDFTIDVKHEVAMFFYQDGKGVDLTDLPIFCINKSLSRKCGTNVRYRVPNCGVVPADDILVAVKTCSKYHKTRLPVVKKTSALNVKHIRYYSDVSDESVPTVDIGVSNTDSGHCAKLHKIITKFKDEEWKGKKWLVVIDDDTIMNFQRLQKLLACYNPDESLLIGEKYGYGVNYQDWGYAYPTGGGGMILSHAAVDNVLTNKDCVCVSPDSPDDMWLGSCFEDVVHSNSLHQTYPSQYNKDFLSHRFLVSFHKHDYQDPFEIFQKYLVGEDKQLPVETIGKTEL